ncbi:hypothetical protein [Flavobacterium agrisoli]|uniref:Collagen-like protein n=1 Tax=Flavobacterium agrisoli TaxID=2793066 RepID=A0A934UIR9_9FLAO|nr:hypothetical protein [Flavobacterium agrisoli]MBK0369181.1 hypothetical protein [Flavobacterium agrisoli]
MKKILTLLAIVGFIAFTSCEGPEGPPGMPGQDGLIAEVFEVNGVTFDNANSYSVFADLNPAIYSGDVILIYRLKGVENGRDVWSPIPESYYYDDGTLYFSYKLDFTQTDINLFLEGFNLNTVPNDLRVNQTFRIVIVPGDDGINAKKVSKPDYSDYYQVIQKYNIDDSKVKKLN